MTSKTRRDFLKTAVKLTILTATGMSVSTINIKFDNNKTISTGKNKKISIEMAEANGACGAGVRCSGGGGMCGEGVRCTGGGGVCGEGVRCTGGGGVCGEGVRCTGS